MPRVDERRLHERPRQLDVGGVGELVRQRELDLARQLRVLALLGRLHRVPQGRAIGERVGRSRRQQDGRVDHVRLAGEVERHSRCGVHPTPAQR